MSGALPGLPFRLWASPNVFPRAVRIICKLHAFVDAGVPIPCVLQCFVKVQAPIICKLQCFVNAQGSILCNLHVFLNVQASILCNLHASVTLQQCIFIFPGSFLGSFCAFGVPWAPLAPILAARGSPRPLPGGRLGCLEVPEPPRDTPGARFWSPRTQIFVRFHKTSLQSSVFTVFREFASLQALIFTIIS